VAADNELALEDLNLEELRAELLSEVQRIFPEYRLVPAKRLKVIPGPDKVVSDAG
jgi:hypothetical protein